MKFVTLHLRKSLATIVLILMMFDGYSQQKINDIKSLADTNIIYIAIVNRFKINAGEEITQVDEKRNLRIKQNDGILEISPFSTGKFTVAYKTAKGIKKVLLISKTLTPAQIRSGEINVETQKIK